MNKLTKKSDAESGGEEFPLTRSQTRASLKGAGFFWGTLITGFCAIVMFLFLTAGLSKPIALVLAMLSTALVVKKFVQKRKRLTARREDLDKKESP